MAGTFSLRQQRPERAALPPGRHGRLERQHRQRLHRRLRPAPGRRRGRWAPPPQPAHVEPLRGRRRRRPGRRRCSGWSTRSSTPAPGASTATSPTSTSAQSVLERVEAGHRRARRERCRGGAGRVPQRLARPGQQPRLRGGPQPGPGPRRHASPTRCPCSGATSRPRRATSASCCCPGSPRSTRWPATSPTTNRSIAVAQMNGTDAGVLLDKRDPLALRLSELTGATATLRTPRAAST